MSNAEEKLPAQSELELASIGSLSRSSVVEAYSTWTAVSNAERLCLKAIDNRSADVLDIGCGAGRHAGWLNGRYHKYLGIDASRSMIDAARKNFPELSFRAEDILSVSLKEEAWDTILLMGNVVDFLHPVERRWALFEKCHTWLRDGGSLVGSSHLTLNGEPKGFYGEDYHGSEIHQYRLSASEMVAEVEEFGFEISIFTRDYRKEPAYWSYWVARKVI